MKEITFYTKIIILAGIVAIGLVTLARLDSIMTEQDNLYYQIVVLQQDIVEVKESIELMDKVDVTNDLASNTTYMGEYTITHYCPESCCCGKWANGYTATGTKATEGRTIAVDPKIIPYGTEVIIDGHTYVAEDCGGAIKGNRIDVYCNSHQEAINRGRITREVYLK